MKWLGIVAFIIISAAGYAQNNLFASEKRSFAQEQWQERFKSSNTYLVDDFEKSNNLFSDTLKTKPPLSSENIAKQYVGGLAGGAAGALGGILVGYGVGKIAYKNSTYEELNVILSAAIGGLAGSIIGIPTGIYIAGNSATQRGNWFATFGGSILFLAIGKALSIALYVPRFPNEPKDPALEMLRVVSWTIFNPLNGGVLGYNLTRKWRKSSSKMSFDF